MQSKSKNKELQFTRFISLTVQASKLLYAPWHLVNRMSSIQVSVKEFVHLSNVYTASEKWKHILVMKCSLTLDHMHWTVQLRHVLRHQHI